MPYGAIKVANELIGHARARGHSLTPLQLIKLVYISHGWAFPILGQPLLNEPAQAWQYGPVIPSVYHAVKYYRSNPIVANLTGDADPQELSAEARDLIHSVYDRYQHLSGTQLSSLTHMADTPWSRVWASQGRNAVIPDKMIADHYNSRMAETA